MTAKKRSIRPGENRLADRMLAPFYGCDNMETDRPPKTGCTGGDLLEHSEPLGKEQALLIDNHCFVWLAGEGARTGTVSARRKGDIEKAEFLLGRKLKVHIVGSEPRNAGTTRKKATPSQPEHQLDFQI